MLHTVARTIPLARICVGLIPFVIADFARLALIVAVPWLALFLPRMLGTM